MYMCFCFGSFFLSSLEGCTVRVMPLNIERNGRMGGVGGTKRSARFHRAEGLRPGHRPKKTDSLKMNGSLKKLVYKKIVATYWLLLSSRK